MSMQQGLGTNLTVPPRDPGDGADVDSCYYVARS
jgi:hypothetical protein